jgi:hypothetical protein
VGGEEDHPEAEFFATTHLFFVGFYASEAFLVAVSFGPATGMKADER